MTLDHLDALEIRIRDLVKLVQDIKRKNASLEDDLRLARERVAVRDDENRRWEQERIDIRSRIEKVLGEIDLLECLDEPKEVAVD
ncbi:MAG: cell division protein ZapB [Nitrospira sp.]